jgi:DnaJ-class molecular chaperone
MDAAWDEVNDYLRGGPQAKANGNRDGDSWGARPGSGAVPVPEELRPDFALLELPFGAGEDECKAAYKRLLKLHHPDRHAGHEGNMRKATERSSRITAAYDRIEKWRATGR